MSDYVLREILEELRAQRKELRELLRVEQANMGYLSRIAIDLNPTPDITNFIIRRKDAMNPINPGSTPVYQATTVPAGAVPTVPPTWVTSDPTNAPITVDPTGLLVTVNVPATAVASTFTLAISYTNLAGVLVTDSISDTIVLPVLDVTGFTIARIS